MTVDDDDPPALTISATDPLSLTEGGDSENVAKSFTVALATEPTEDVTVSVTNPGPGRRERFDRVAEFHDDELEHGADSDGNCSG